MFALFRKKNLPPAEAVAVAATAPPPVDLGARFTVMPSNFLPRESGNSHRWVGILIVASGVLLLVVGGVLGFRYLMQTPVVTLDTVKSTTGTVTPGTPEPAVPGSFTPSAPRTLRAVVSDASGVEISSGRLLIPAEALAELSRVALVGEVIAQPARETVDGLLVSGRYSVTPADSKFQREVRLVIDYSALVSASFSEQDLQGVVQVNDLWSQDPTSVVEPTAKTVTFTIQGTPAEGYAVLVARPKTVAVVPAGGQKLASRVDRPALGVDSDGDSLSDEEEVIFGSDPRRPDTDQDGFLDGLEVLSLYSPRAAQVALEQSDLVARFSNDTFGYSWLYPARFLTRYLDLTKRELLISTATGEFFEVAVQDNPEQLITRQWVAKQFPDQDVTSLKSSTIDDVFAIWSPDELTVYAARGSYVYVISYSPGALTRLNFVTTFTMMVKSVKFSVPTSGTAPTQ